MKLTTHQPPTAAGSAMDAVVRKTMEMDLPWDWPCGVAYYGVACAYEATGKQEYP